MPVSTPTSPALAPPDALTHDAPTGEVHSAPLREACWRALQAHDARFDGRFFTAVRSTGVYCRPVCRVRVPKLGNCRFFALAAQAEAAGFRPCLRCRPELAPAIAPTHAIPATPAEALPWSVHDSTRTLALQAARLLDTPDAWGPAGPSVAALAQHMGVSDRHLRRVFEAHLGVTPLAYLQTRRLLMAKQLLTDTRLAISQVAHVSGFGSERAFHAAFTRHYRLNPSSLRRSVAAAHPTAPGITMQLGYRPPYDHAHMLAFWRQRQLAGVDWAGTGDSLQWARTLRLATSADPAAPAVHGWLQVGFVPDQHSVRVQVADSLAHALPHVIARVRAALDLDADPAAIDAVLAADFPDQAGTRVPGAFDGFEVAVRAVLGQQVSVAAARTLSQRLCHALGDPIRTPWPELNRLFPTPQAVAHASADMLGGLGIVRQRHEAIRALAHAVATGQLTLHPGADVAATVAALQALPGIGAWTAHYIALRVLRWPDAFLAGDIALHTALGLRDECSAARRAQRATDMAERWRPWRAYAVARAWHTL
jgi:AraC family transcriptional regulator, regulatory protein of adaptative response / DNA-3-methyladenine glycosylase II